MMCGLKKLKLINKKINFRIFFKYSFRILTIYLGRYLDEIKWIETSIKYCHFKNST